MSESGMTWSLRSEAIPVARTPRGNPPAVHGAKKFSMKKTGATML